MSMQPSDLKSRSTLAIIVTCWSGKEDTCAKAIEEQTSRVAVVPKLIRKIIPRNRKARIIVESAKPLYPGYIFVEHPSSDGWMRIVDAHRCITGVLRRSLFEPYLIKMDRISADVREDVKEFPYKEGDVVWIASGPFAGRRAKIVQEDRVEIILLGKAIQVYMPSSMLERVS